VTDYRNLYHGTGNATWVQNRQYDAAGRQTSLQLWIGNGYQGTGVYTTEGRAYNQNGQMTDLSWAGAPAYLPSLNFPASAVQYVFPANGSGQAANNGQITQMKDTLSGETISYA